MAHMRVSYAASALALLIGVTTAAGCDATSVRETPPIALTWEVLDNLQGAGDSFRSQLTFIHQDRTPWPDRDWALYFNFGRAILTDSAPPVVEITHINGDFFRLTPSDTFPTLQPGERLSIPFDSRDWSIKESDAPSGAYFVFARDGGDPSPPVPMPITVLPFETERQTTRTPGDQLEVPTPASRYRANAGLTELPPGTAGTIVPTPVKTTPIDGRFILARTTQIHHADELAAEGAFLADALEAPLGTRLGTTPSTGPAEDAIVLTTGDVTVGGELGGEEAYRLAVTPGGVEIVGTGAAGVLYGIQSLRGLLPVDAYGNVQEVIPVDAVAIEDAPRFPYRGFHLDVARNFQPKDQVLKLLDLMALYKLNTFHFHLTDDEGWRLDIRALPELTEIGGRRGHTLNESDRLSPSFGSGPDPGIAPGSGHYTRDDFIDLIRYAQSRYIEVIPEVDVPGHARAALKAMDARHARLMAADHEEDADAYRLRDPEDVSVYQSVQRWNDNVMNVCLPSTYRFLEAVFDEIESMYAEAGVPLTTIHIGGDEVPHGVWEQSPVCNALIAADETLHDVHDLRDYFFRRVGDLLTSRGLVTAGWEEIALIERTVEGQTVKAPNEAAVDRALRAYAWNSVWGLGSEDVVYKLANAGFRVVMSNASSLYFDLAYDKDPVEPGYDWAGLVDTRTPFELVPFDLFKNARTDLMGNPLSPSVFADRVRPTEAGRQNILGLQGQLWGETLNNPERMEYMAFPRLISLAERAWAPRPDWSKLTDDAPREQALATAWNIFANRLGQRELPRLDYLHGGIRYRLPPPGGVIEDGMLKANVELPGLTIRYTSDGTDPTADSPEYTGPVAVSGTAKLKTFDTRGRGSRTIVVAPGQ